MFFANELLTLMATRRSEWCISKAAWTVPFPVPEQVKYGNMILSRMVHIKDKLH